MTMFIQSNSFIINQTGTLLNDDFIHNVIIDTIADFQHITQSKPLYFVNIMSDQIYTFIFFPTSYQDYEQSPTKNGHIFRK